MEGFEVKRSYGNVSVTFPDGYKVSGINNTAGIGKPRRTDDELIAIAQRLRGAREAEYARFLERAATGQVGKTFR